MVEKVRLLPDKALQKGLIDKLGRDVIGEAAFNVYLWGYQKRFVPIMLPKFLMMAKKDENGKVAEGFLVRPSKRDFTLVWNDDVPYVRLVGTISMYVPGRAAAVDYLIVVRPVHPYFSDEPTYFSTSGTVVWSHLRDIPYDEGVWDAPPQKLNE